MKSKGIQRFWKTVAIAAVALLTGAAATRPADAQSGQQFIFPTTPLPLPRAFHGCAVLGSYFYVIGGQESRGPRDEDEVPTPSVVKAPILDNGTLGPWQATTPLPAPRLYINSSTIVLDDVVYVVGGADLATDGNKYTTALYSRPGPDGQLSQWVESRPFAESGLSQFVAISTPGHIHIIGGYDQGRVVLAEVWSNALAPDGSMTEWFPGPAMPLPLWFHSAAVSGGRVYTWGGLSASKVSEGLSDRIFSAPIMGSGVLGNWREEPIRLPQPIYTASNAVAGPYLISLCPRYAGGNLGSEAWFSFATPNGLTPWGATSIGVPNRVYHAAATDYRLGLIFLSGGRASRDTPQLADQFVLRLSPEVRQAAEQNWSGGQRTSAATESASATGGRAGADQLSYVTAQRLSTDSVGGFRTYDQARFESQARRVPLVLYFNLPKAQPCQEQRTVLENTAFTGVATQAAFAWVNAMENPQLTQQLGVYRVPTWVFYDKGGNEIREARITGTLSIEDLGRRITRLQ